MDTEPTIEVVSMEEMERGKKIQTDVQMILEVISQVYKVKSKYINNDSMGGYPYLLSLRCLQTRILDLHENVF